MLQILSQNTVFSGFLKSILQCINFSEDVTLLNSVDYIKGEYLTYPNITICHPAFFDMDRLQGKMMFFRFSKKGKVLIEFIMIKIDLS